MSLDGLVIVITGGSRGIGRELAGACVRRGAHVITCARHVETPDAVDGRIEMVADVTIEADIARVVARAREQFGRIDILVNNAAIGRGEPAHVFATNVTAPLMFARAVLAMTPTARIVNVSSGIVVHPRAGAAEYLVSKHALEGVSRALVCDAPDATIVTVRLGAHRTSIDRHTAEASDPALDAAPIASALPPLLEAMTGPNLHGRTIEAWRGCWPIDRSSVDALAHPLGPSPRARDALAEHARSGSLEHYPGRAVGALRKLIAAEHRVPLDSIVIGAGASELLDRILATFVRPGDPIVANTPSWPLFPQLCGSRGVVARTIPYRLTGRRVDHDLDAVAAAIDRTVRLVYLISPANPMGCALDAEPFTRFLAKLSEDIVVVIDEAYGEFITRSDAVDAPSLARRDPRVIAVRTFSKLHGLASLRIGYAIGSPCLARMLEANARPFLVTEAAAVAAGAALVDRGHARASLAAVVAGRADHLDALDSDAPFALVPVGSIASGASLQTATYFDGRYAMVPLWRATRTT